MKKILGLDLGTASIGWALVNEAETADEKSSIIKLGVRVNPLTVDEKSNFEKGKSITTNADRTLKRSMRRSLQRYKLRREVLKNKLIEEGIIHKDSFLTEMGKSTTFETLRLRSRAAVEQVSLEEFGRILLTINKKRGYKSSRKAKSSDEGEAIDGMAIAMKLYNEHLTPGAYVYDLLQQGKRVIPDFYRSDLQAEFDEIWRVQQAYYPEQLTDELKEKLRQRNKNQTWAICKEPFQLEGIKRTTKGMEQTLEDYKWRVEALYEQMGLEELAIVLQNINGQLLRSSGYLGEISDRSKSLYFNHQTIGQYLMQKLESNAHYSTKNKVFYRQDYLDEFEIIWETQAKYHPELTPEFKRDIRDVVIFYQRPLKSQKGLISFCEFEQEERTVVIDGKEKVIVTGSKVCPKSSPLFQEFKIWQILNNVVLTREEPREKRALTAEEKELLFKELSLKKRLTKPEALTLLFKQPKLYDLNYKNLDGNQTQAELYAAYKTILELSGDDVDAFEKKGAEEAEKMVNDVFKDLGINSAILQFDSSLEGKAFDKQPAYQLWHLLYSYAGDQSKSGDESLLKKLEQDFGFPIEYARVLSGVIFKDDYGSLSAKAIRKILPFMKEGDGYDVACEKAGYRHSQRSLTREELTQRSYVDTLSVLPKNSLRNPVVEKILNQMINVVNSIVEKYGKPDEIRIELARELKKSAKEREELTDALTKATAQREQYRSILQKEFGMTNVTSNDILRYRLYLELKDNGFKTLYSNTYIEPSELIGKEFDIEHIIPQSRLFDDSFSNKTLELHSVNIEKSNDTAMEYMLKKHDKNEVEAYKIRIDTLLKKGVISKSKAMKLLMRESEIPTGFIERDLRDSQYIAKKARELLEEMVMFVVPTTGSITDRLREDWQLVDVMQELNWDKYDRLGLTENKVDKDGRIIKRITDWSKRNDHRHHAMDALTIAFTKRQYIQYMNNLNARLEHPMDEPIQIKDYDLSHIDKKQRSAVVYAIERKEMYRDSKGKLRFNPPMPLDEFRRAAKSSLDEVLVSIKSKNKVVTRNVNVIKKRQGVEKNIQLTPRGQLHDETIYGKKLHYETKQERVGASFTADKIATISVKRYREALLKRLQEYGNDAKKAFTGANSLAKKPVYLDELHTISVPESVQTVQLQSFFTIRKAVTPDLKLEKVVDVAVRRVLQQRLDEFGGDARKAFSNLDENPIWINKEKGICVKRVAITGVANAIALRDKHDLCGKPILTDEGLPMPNDYICTGNNHHVAIYRNQNGNYQESVVSFLEVTQRVNLGLPVVDKSYRQSEGWQFLFTMKQNEYFVFPEYEEVVGDSGETEQRMLFNPKEVNLMDPQNYALISAHLFRVQKIGSLYYVFRHHLETTVTESKALFGVVYKRVRNLKTINEMVKVRVNHLGEIVAVGEY